MFRKVFIMRKDKKKRLQRLADRRNERKLLRQKSQNCYTGELFCGKITINPSGFGFVKVVPESEDAEAKEWFIPAKYINGAMHGDTVHIAPLPPDPRYSSDEKEDRRLNYAS